MVAAYWLAVDDYYLPDAGWSQHHSGWLYMVSALV